MVPARLWHLLLLAGLLGLQGGLACSEGSSVPIGIPDDDALRARIREASHALERQSCLGCPDRWDLRPCQFHEALASAPSGGLPELCSAARPLLGHRQPPETALQKARGLLDQADRQLKTPDQALKLYAIGSDLMRLGSLPAWREGQALRERALRRLAAEERGGAWAAELWSLEENAPQPGRLALVLLIDTFNQRPSHDWKARAALDQGIRAAEEALRGSPEARARAVIDVEERLAPHRARQEDEDLLLAWNRAEAQRLAAQQVALDGMLRGHRPCPTRLDDLGLHVRGELTLDRDRCRAVSTGWQDRTRPPVEAGGQAQAATP